MDRYYLTSEGNPYQCAWISSGRLKKKFTLWIEVKVNKSLYVDGMIADVFKYVVEN